MYLRHLRIVYYAAKGKDAKAKKVLQRLYSRVPGYDVEKEYLDIKRDVEQQKLLAKEVSMWEIFRGTNLRRTSKPHIVHLTRPDCLD